MPNMNSVSILNNVVFAFEMELAGFFEDHFCLMTCGRDGARPSTCFGGGYEFAVMHDFGADEAAGDVAVNGVGGFDGVGAMPDGPGADFVFAGGEEADVSKRFVE